ncbi:MAG: CBS domain-containing protein [Bacteriovoracaceae bacterium]|jgi:signal-transduction protein with cAMP-binding, CBS, and nucleotidyltransferase domain|nr:CBS domain-containing protein [Bacteriovoracaceae bacterium]
MLSKVFSSIINQDNLTTLSCDATVQEATQAMKDHGATLICEREGVEGIFTEQDLLYKVLARGKDPLETAVSEVMSPSPQHIDVNDDLICALQMMNGSGLHHLPVLDGTSVLGIISIKDIYHSALIQLKEDLENLFASDAFLQKVVPRLIKNQNPIILNPSESIQSVVTKMAKHEQGTTIIENDNQLMGIFTEHDLAYKVVAKKMSLTTTSVGEVMTVGPDTIGLEATMIDIVKTMHAGNYRHLPAHDGYKVHGIVSIEDLYKILGVEMEKDFARALSDRNNRWAFGV